MFVRVPSMKKHFTCLFTQIVVRCMSTSGIGWQWFFDEIVVVRYAIKSTGWFEGIGWLEEDGSQKKKKHFFCLKDGEWGSNED